MKKLTMSFLIISVFCINLSAAEYALVANKNITSITKEKLKAIFLKKLVILGESKVIPVNLSPRDPVRNSFEKNIIGMHFNRLKSYWTKQHYLGHRPPLTMKSQESVLAFIKKVDGSIGYVNLENVSDDIKIIYRWSD